MLATTKRGLTWAVRMLAHSVGVNVVEDPKAATFQMRRDGVFVCPVMNEEDPVFADLINGAGIHEIAHFLESDFQILDQCSPVERSFMMIFEDLRIERWAQFRWKGAASEMKRLQNKGREHPRGQGSDRAVVGSRQVVPRAAARRLRPLRAK